MANHNRGRKFPPDPMTPEDIVKLLKAITPQGPSEAEILSAERLRSLVIVMWRSGLRISEALDLEDRDLRTRDMVIVVRNGKGGRRRLVAMDDWGWKKLNHWIDVRHELLPPGPVFCLVRGKNKGVSRMAASDVRRQLRRSATLANLNRRANPHSLRHGHAVELWREGFDVYTIQNQLGHARLDVTAEYLRGIASVELLDPIRKRKPPVIQIDLNS